MSSSRLRVALLPMAYLFAVACSEPATSPERRPPPNFIFGSDGPCEKYTTISVLLRNCYVKQLGVLNPYNPYTSGALHCPVGYCVSSFPLAGTRYTMFQNALGSMSALGGACAAGAALISDLYWDARVSFFWELDTNSLDTAWATTWPSPPGNLPPLLALHIWSGAFNKPPAAFLWLMGHEAYHFLNPGSTSEDAANSFATSCGGVW